MLTGASGFLGSIIRNNLAVSANIFSVGRSGESDLPCDISKTVPIFQQRFDYVVHAAGKAHAVPKTQEEADSFFAVNLEGTKNLLLGLERAGLPAAFVFISTVSVYGVENGEMLSEQTTLAGKSPYALSKILAEVYVQEWGVKNGVPVLILRLPLIAGPQPPGNLGKMIAAIKKRRYLSIGQGKARKSVVMAEDVAELIGNNFGKAGVYNLTDRCHPSFRELEQVICHQLEKPLSPSLPLWSAKILGKMGDLVSIFPINSDMVLKMTKNLTFDDEKAVAELNWNPQSVINHFKII